MQEREIHRNKEFGTEQVKMLFTENMISIENPKDSTQSPTVINK